MKEQGGRRKSESGMNGRRGGTMEATGERPGLPLLPEEGCPRSGRGGGSRMNRIAAAVIIASLAGCGTMSAPSLLEQAMPVGWKNAASATNTAETSWPDPA